MLDIPSTDNWHDRFWSHVDIRSNSECWEWKSSRRTGKWPYGRFWLENRVYNSNRVALSIKLKRSLLRDELACHHCDNPPCCNPAHLFVGSQKDNLGDAIKKGRIHRWNDARRGENNTNAKLTVRQINEIKSLIGAVPGIGLAERFGVSPSTISKIKRRPGYFGCDEAIEALQAACREFVQ